MTASRTWHSAIDLPELLDKHLAGRRIGLITNPSGVAANFIPTSEILAARYGLSALFGPEHGVHGDVQAGLSVATHYNSRFNIPEYSLYGETRALTPAMLHDIDVLVFDIQDIGSRYYTYIYTLGESLTAAAALGLPFVVLDRPNPLGGMQAEGIVIRPAFHSFVGNYGLPARHPLTIGEMARRINRLLHLQADLTVIPCPAWDRTPLPPTHSWLNPSPNMPSLTTARLYSGTCLLEGTNISEGRGTTRPYEIIGAPFLPHYEAATLLNSLELPGVVFRACCFTPTFSKHQGSLCRGLQLHITDPDNFNGFVTGLHLFDTLRRLTPEMEITSPAHLNHLFGDDSLLTDNLPLPELLQRAAHESAAFMRESVVDWLYAPRDGASGERIELAQA